MVASAKSWLCAVGVERDAQILPWGAPDDVPHVSPVEAAAAYLGHLRAAWDASMPAPLAEQEVYLAVPASFDAAARELTMRAADAAGLRGAHLVEEPQAAFYAYLAATRGAWREQVRTGEVILVCDVGGGTTDFSLVAVGEEAGALVLERKAVGDHILLGGDNMDLALAHARPRAPRREGHDARRMAAPRPRPRLPRRQGEAPHRRRQGEGAGRRPRPLAEGDRRHAPHRRRAARGGGDTRRRVLPGGRSRRDAARHAAGRAPGDRAALRERSRDHAAPGRVPQRGIARWRRRA